MTQKTLHRKPSAPQGRVRSAPRPPKMRAGKKRRLSRGSILLLLALTYGSTVALLLVAVGFTAVVRDGGESHGSHQPHSAGAEPNHDHAQSNSGAQANIQIQARHMGNLVLDIKAEVSLNKSRDPLMKAKVAAYTDMAEMPGAHGQGPLRLQAADGKPGLYEITTRVPMPGNYQIRIVVEEPVQAERTTTVAVSAVGAR